MSLTIVHLLSSFGVGGQERVAFDLAAAQHRGGHTVHVASLAPPPDGPFAQEFRDAGIGVHRVPKRGPSVDPSLPARLALLFRRLKADIVHTHNPMPMLYGAPGGALARAAVVHSKHGRNPATARQKWIRRQAARLVDRFVAVADTTAEQAIAQQEYPADEVLVIPNGIDLARYRPNSQERADMRSALGISADAWVVGTVGRLDAFKNQQLLIRAADPLLGPNFHVVVIGDGPSRAEVESAAAQCSAPASIHVLGRRSDVGALLTGLDCFVLCSTSEGLPLVVPEAMAAGLPVVCTSVGGLPGVVDEGETGYLVPSGDERALGERISLLAGDRPLARRMGARARERALERYSADRMAAQYMQLYGELCRSRRR